jgi:hypothetical protein
MQVNHNSHARGEYTRGHAGLAGIPDRRVPTPSLRALEPTTAGGMAALRHEGPRVIACDHARRWGINILTGLGKGTSEAASRAQRRRGGGAVRVR